MIYWATFGNRACAWTRFGFFNSASWGMGRGMSRLNFDQHVNVKFGFFSI